MAICYALITRSSCAQAGIMFPLTPRPPNLNLPIGTRTHRSRGSSYEITYLDGDMLIGKAQASGGVFIFTKRLDDAELDDT